MRRCAARCATTRAGISEHFVPTAGDAFIGGVDQAIAGVDSVVDEAFDSGFIDLLGR